MAVKLGSGLTAKAMKTTKKRSRGTTPYTVTVETGPARVARVDAAYMLLDLFMENLTPQEIRDVLRRASKSIAQRTASTPTPSKGRAPKSTTRRPR